LVLAFLITGTGSVLANLVRVVRTYDIIQDKSTSDDLGSVNETVCPRSQVIVELLGSIEVTKDTRSVDTVRGKVVVELVGDRCARDDGKVCISAHQAILEISDSSSLGKHSTLVDV
jgi:hypothetical protein